MKPTALFALLTIQRTPPAGDPPLPDIDVFVGAKDLESLQTVAFFIGHQELLNPDNTHRFMLVSPTGPQPITLE